MAVQLDIGSKAPRSKSFELVLCRFYNRKKKMRLKTNYGGNIAHWFAMNADRRRHRGDIKVVGGIL